ncbi:glycosyltransferase [Gracilibacillus sp. S3-1-1]|uniref:Glycosyltransferase n=1 Tax=Gracilibacillus pellucidus TaxID=3095368 RepID=A0ACC6M840_9BACI|nr:glycosyltransferase [Gracilibacillus sp. S3-1-1]MDX8047124.1 glycosyltransferase [Gracilibacillus sp. S3-1-1]
MKRVLITGKNSYVGNSFESWIKERYPEDIQIDKISVRTDGWKEIDLSVYDVVLHVAGIAHVSTDPKMEELYYNVNRNLTVEIAKKSKESGVKQFIFLSSIIVYGDATKGSKVINENSLPTPSNFYGKSKLEAEKAIDELNSDEFHVVRIRPPMIYGKGAKGNYPKLSKIAQKTPLFPDISNERSMLHIDNLSEFIRLMIKNEESGLFFPQNDEYVRTSKMVEIIAQTHGKKIRLTKLLNPVIKFLVNKVNVVSKVFGNLVYDEGISDYHTNYRVRSMKNSIEATEKVEEENVNILIMGDNGLETVGGEQESTKIIIQGIHDTYKVGVIQPGKISNPITGVKYYYLTEKTRIKHLIVNPFVFLGYINKIRKIINHETPEIIHTQAQVSFFIVALLRKSKLIPKKTTLIHTERGLYTKYGNFFKKVFLFFMKELDVLVLTTQFNSKYWKEAIEKKELNMKFQVIENTAGKLFEEYNTVINKDQTEDIVIGFAGRYTEWKNWPLAVGICEKLDEKLKGKFRVRMAVGCLDEKSSKETRLMFDKLKHLLGDRFNGQINIDIDEMNKFYYDIDVFILTSRYNTESFGRTLVEAMSRRTIVLTTDSGGSVEVVGNMDNVCESADEFVEKVISYNNDSKKMSNEKEANIKRVKEQYSLNNNIEKHRHLYQKIYQ